MGVEELAQKLREPAVLAETLGSVLSSLSLQLQGIWWTPCSHAVHIDMQAQHSYKLILFNYDMYYNLINYKILRNLNHSIVLVNKLYNIYFNTLPSSWDY